MRLFSSSKFSQIASMLVNSPPWKHFEALMINIWCLAVGRWRRKYWRHCLATPWHIEYTFDSVAILSLDESTRKFQTSSKMKTFGASIQPFKPNCQYRCFFGELHKVTVWAFMFIRAIGVYTSSYERLQYPPASTSPSAFAFLYSSMP